MLGWSFKLFRIAFEILNLEQLSASFIVLVGASFNIHTSLDEWFG